jgi:glycosyltransferase involved in cell wall biosynthesis
MDLLVTLEHHFFRHSDGAVYTPTAYTYRFWERYLRVFERVFVLARVSSTRAFSGLEPRSDGDGVQFIDLPDYRGPLDYLLHRHALTHIIEAALRPPRALLLRCPSQVGALVCRHARRMDRPYAVEVVGDPGEAFARGGSAHPLRPLLRWEFGACLRRICRGARAVGYVSGGVLPHRYPARYDAATAVYSSVELDAGAFAGLARHHRPLDRPRLVTVASLGQSCQGVDVLLRALAAVRAAGLDASLDVVGDGRYRATLESLSRRLGLGGHVVFHGELPGSAEVRLRLADADLFVLPSRGGGLPGALVEAMALGLPCLGTRTGGIAELLAADSLVEPNDAAALARAIREQIGNPAGLDRASRANLQRARAFEQAALEPRRTRLYRHLHAVTESALTRFAPAAYAATLPRHTN